MATFGLVHGAWQGSWCWEPLVRELARRGHRAVAMDLPAEDPDAGAAAYAQTVSAALAAAGCGDDVVLVGHSLAGLTVPVVAARRPVRRLVYLCAMLPEPGRSVDERARGGERMTVRGLGQGQARDPDGSSLWVDLDAAARRLCPDCPPDVAAAATARMRRQAWRVTAEVTPLTAWPKVDRRYLLCVEDRVIDPDWSRRAARELLGVEPVELPGDHSPMLSRPAVLADVLADLG